MMDNLDDQMNDLRDRVARLEQVIIEIGQAFAVFHRFTEERQKLVEFLIEKLMGPDGVRT